MTLVKLCVLILVLKGFFDLTISGSTPVSVMEGDSVTLHTNLTHIQTDDQILWLFGLQATRIAEIYYQKPNTYDKTGRYGGRLRINTQTGSLTITNISTTESGLHELQIINGRGTLFKRFNVTVYDENRSHVCAITAAAAAAVFMVFIVIVVAVKHRCVCL